MIENNSLEGFTLVFPLHKQIIASWSNLYELKDRGKALQAIACLLCPVRGRCPRLPTSASRCVQPSRLFVGEALLLVRLSSCKYPKTLFLHRS